jgi:5'-3' exonuclease
MAVRATVAFPQKTERSALVIDLTNIARTHWQAMIGNDVAPADAHERLAGDVVSRIMHKAWDLSPTLMITTLDSVGKTRRHKVWPQYKGDRSPADPGFLVELGRIREWFKAMRVPVLYDDGIEADDQIGTVVAKIRVVLPDAKIVIWSGDNDFLQIVDSQTVLWNGRTELAIGPADVLATRGVRTDQFAEFMALVGDKDEVPGVAGIGEVGAAKLLSAHGTLEQAIAIARYRSGREYEALDKHKETARLSLQLATLHRDAPAALSMSLPEAMYGWDMDDADDAAGVARRVRRRIPKYHPYGKPAPFYDWKLAWTAAEGKRLEPLKKSEPASAAASAPNIDAPATAVVSAMETGGTVPKPKQLALF